MASSPLKGIQEDAVAECWVLCGGKRPAAGEVKLDTGISRCFLLPRVHSRASAAWKASHVPV